MARLRARGSVDAGREWRESILVGDPATAMTRDGRATAPRVAYRLQCDGGYYGRRCDLSCSPRHDKFGHYECSENGSRVCLDGWSGNFCDVREYTYGDSDVVFSSISMPVDYRRHLVGKNS